MPDITLAQADAIADRALPSGREHKFKPLTVAVLDAGGHLKVLKRADNSSLLRPEIAIGKAWGVLGMGLGGRELARRAEKMPTFFTALNAMSGGRIRDELSLAEFDEKRILAGAFAAHMAPQASLRAVGAS